MSGQSWQLWQERKKSLTLHCFPPCPCCCCCCFFFFSLPSSRVPLLLLSLLFFLFGNESSSSSRKLALVLPSPSLNIVCHLGTSSVEEEEDFVAGPAGGKWPFSLSLLSLPHRSGTTFRQEQTNGQNGRGTSQR